MLDNDEEEESKQVDQMEEMKEGSLPEFGHKSSFYTQRAPLDRYFVKEAVTQLTDRRTPEKVHFCPRQIQD